MLIFLVWITLHGPLGQKILPTPWPERPLPSSQTPDPIFLKYVHPIGIRVSLAGVRLGEPATAVRGRFGRPKQTGYLTICDTEHEYWYYPLQAQQGQLTLEIVQGLIVDVDAEFAAVKPVGISDSYGIRIGDSAEKIRVIRGASDGGEEWEYNLAYRVAESYTVSHNRVAEIRLSWDTAP